MESTRHQANFPGKTCLEPVAPLAACHVVHLDSSSKHGHLLWAWPRTGSVGKCKGRFASAGLRNHLQPDGFHGLPTSFPSLELSPGKARSSCI